jgi:hypothetical protein
VRLLSASLLTLHLAGVAFAQSGRSTDTLKGEFLFYTGSRAYVRCDSTARANDTVWCDRLGPVVRAAAPIWEFVADAGNRLEKGQQVLVFRKPLPRRAARLSVVGGHDAWDPVQLRTAAGWALWPLFHRALFAVGPDGTLSGDLARSWFWRGTDLFVVVDTSVRFGDGSPVDAYGVKTSLERYLWYVRDVPDYSWHYCLAGVENYRKGRIGHVVGLIPRGRDTLQFNLARPNFSLPERLASPATAIVRWTRNPDGAPVVASCGYYGTVDSGSAADIFEGRDLHQGSLVISHQVTDRVWIGEADSPPCARERVPAPRLLVVRPVRPLPDGMLSFLHWAIDRNAMIAQSDGDRSYHAGLFPVGRVPNPTRTGFEFDYAKAQAARQRLPGRPSLAIAFARGLEEEAQYLVTALKAWNVRAAFSSSSEAADIRLELWDFESFVADAQIERAFEHTGVTRDDSLVSLLESVRATSDDLRRTVLYRSLRTRLEDRGPYMVLLQTDALVTACAAPLEHARDAWGRYVGPIFLAESKP